MILTVGLISLYVNGNVNNLKYKKMGLGIKPTLRSTLENKSFQEKSLSKAAALKPASKSSLMKKGGKIIKKAQFGYNLGKAAGAVAGKVARVKASLKKVGEDIKQAERNYKTADSLRKAEPKAKSFPANAMERKSNRLKADSLYKAGRKLEGLESLDYKKGGKIIKKAQNGKKTSFGMLSVKAGVDNNPSATFADKIAGAKKKAKFGKKMQYGGAAASMVPTMKKGGMKKKYKHGGTVSMQLGSYTRQIGKNYTGKNVVNKGAKAKMGKSVGKCKYGC
jgi:hypothetical protein